MRRIQIRSLALAAAVLFTFAGSAHAQDASSALLNGLEVQRLVERAAPEDHAQLSAHFTALAQRYDAAAKRHVSMARGFTGNPSRNLTTGLDAHCTRLAEANAQAATVIRQLATHHQALAAGKPSVAPAAAARFDAGAGAPDPSDEALTRLAATATTAADHRELEAYFLTLAKRYAEDAADHAKLARAYRGRPRAPAGSAAAATHCDRLEALAREAAQAATGAAAEHRALGSSTTR